MYMTGRLNDADRDGILPTGGAAVSGKGTGGQVHLRL